MHGSWYAAAVFIVALAVAGVWLGAVERPDAGGPTARHRAATASAPALGPMRVAELSTRDLAHRSLVVTVAGRRAWGVSDAAAAYNLAHYGVRNPAAVVRRFRPGGIIYFSGNVSTIEQVRKLSVGLQAAARESGYRLLIMTDQEADECGASRATRLGRSPPRRPTTDTRGRPGVMPAGSAQRCAPCGSWSTSLRWRTSTRWVTTA